jgi:hypothetical protein
MPNRGRVPETFLQLLHKMANNDYGSKAELGQWLMVSKEEAGHMIIPEVEAFESKVANLDLGDVAARRKLSDDAAAKRKELMADKRYFVA